MTKAGILAGVFAMGAAGLGALSLSQGPPVGQANSVGIVEGTVMLHGTTEPLAGVEIAVGGPVLGAATNAGRGGVRGAAWQRISPLVQSRLG